MNAVTGNGRAIVYVSNANSRDISVLELSEGDGRLALVETVAAGGRLMPMAVSPDRRFLYAGLRSEPYAVRSFAIAPESGTLNPVATAPLADNMAYLATDRRGRFLFGASYSGSRFSVSRIGAKGQVDATPLAVIPTGKNAHAVATDPTNTFLFVTCLGDDMILQYRFDERTGELTPNEPPAVATQPGAGPRHFVFHPNRRFVFVVNELNGTVDTYRLAADGTLALVQTVSVLPSDFSGEPWAADIHLTPDGRFLYTSERTSSTLAAFGVDGDSGELTALGHYVTEAQPRGFNIDPAGAYVVVAGEESDGLSVYAIDRQTGALDKTAEASAGDGPNWVEIIALPR